MNKIHPFPLPVGPEATWNAQEHQAAANHYWYEIMGVDRDASNYRPYLSLLESAFNRHTRYAKRLRASPIPFAAPCAPPSPQTGRAEA